MLLMHFAAIWASSEDKSDPTSGPWADVVPGSCLWVCVLQRSYSSPSFGVLSKLHCPQGMVMGFVTEWLEGVFGENAKADVDRHHLVDATRSPAQFTTKPGVGIPGECVCFKSLPRPQWKVDKCCHLCHQVVPLPNLYSSPCLVGTPLHRSKSVPRWQVALRHREAKFPKTWLFCELEINNALNPI